MLGGGGGGGAVAVALLRCSFKGQRGNAEMQTMMVMGLLLVVRGRKGRGGRFLNFILFYFIHKSSFLFLLVVHVWVVG